MIVCMRMFFPKDGLYINQMGILVIKIIEALCWCNMKKVDDIRYSLGSRLVK